LRLSFNGPEEQGLDVTHTRWRRESQPQNDILALLTSERKAPMETTESRVRKRRLKPDVKQVFDKPASFKVLNA
jgi:hypothetical protein